MRKKNRTRKSTVYISMEGDREIVFYQYLVELYNPKNNGINITRSPNTGGTPDRVINDTLKNLHYNKTYAWFDEDTPIGNSDNFNVYEGLRVAWNLKEEIDITIPSKDLMNIYNPTKRNPILIVSTPLSIEGILIRLFDKKLPTFKEPLLHNKNIEDNKNTIKSAVCGIFDCKYDENIEMAYYRKNLSKEILEEKAKVIEELGLLLSIFKKS